MSLFSFFMINLFALCTCISIWLKFQGKSLENIPSAWLLIIQSILDIFDTHKTKTPECTTHMDYRSTINPTVSKVFIISYPDKQNQNSRICSLVLRGLQPLTVCIWRCNSLALFCSVKKFEMNANLTFLFMCMFLCYEDRAGSHRTGIGLSSILFSTDRNRKKCMFLCYIMQKRNSSIYTT